MRFSTIAPLLLALTVLPAHSGEVYKWKSESGETQYGQFPPAGVKAERMTPSGLKSQPEAEPEAQEAADSEAGDADQTTEAEASEQDSEATSAQQPNANTPNPDDSALVAQRKSNCAAARGNLAVLQKEGHRRMRLPDGTMVHLTDEQRTERIEEAKRQIEAYCE